MNEEAISRAGNRLGATMSRDEEDDSGDEVDLDTAIQFIVAHAPRAQLIELYYWIQEHELLKIVRGLATASRTTREALALFLDDATPQHAEVEGFSNGTEFTLRKLYKLQ